MTNGAKLRLMGNDYNEDVDGLNVLLYTTED